MNHTLTPDAHVNTWLRRHRPTEELRFWWQYAGYAGALLLVAVIGGLLAMHEARTQGYAQCRVDLATLSQTADIMQRTVVVPFSPDPTCGQLVARYH